MSSLQKYLVRSSAQFLIRFFSFDVELYELLIYVGYDHNLVISFTNIFSHSVGCLFILLMVSFAVHKFLSLISSHLFIFAFISFVLGDRFKTILLHMCQRVLPMFSSRSFMVSSLIFVSLIHLELICVYSIRKCPNFIFSHVAVQFLQLQLLKRFFSPPFNIVACFVIE